MYYRDWTPFDMAGGSFGLCVVALIIEVWLCVKITLLIIRAFINHPKSKWLWGFLVTLVLSLVGGGMIALQSQGQEVTDPVQRIVAGVCIALAAVGFLGLVITSLVYHLQDSDTLQPEKVNLVDSILKQSWWGEDKPLEFEREQVAA